MSLQELLTNPSFIQQVNWTEKRYKQGDVVMKENNAGNDLFIVLNGELEVRTDLSESLDTAMENKGLGLARLKAGDIFGEFSLFDKEPRSAKVLASTKCTIAKVNGQKLIQFMDNNPAEGYLLMREFFENLVSIMRQGNIRTKTILEMYLSS
ncbi:MAG: cyclic nucleotide-binding domain-containing protein [Methylococcales bacterium]|nr:cyclic nucleotide-binding domain-containing protein [Methylococcales bacterium]